MKLLDSLFILLSAAILILLSELGYGDLLGRFAVLILLISYYSGKAITKWQLQKQKV